MITLLTLIGLALATQIELGTVPCAVGSEPTQIARLVSKDSLGGWDNDGARYAQGGQWRERAVATCPGSLLSLYNRDMLRALTDKEKSRLQPVINQQKQLNGDTLRVWDRYALAADAYAALGRDPWSLAQLYLQASWTVRDAMVLGAPPVQGGEQGLAMLQTVESELKKPLSDTQRKTLLFNAAKIAQRVGAPLSRERTLKQLRAFSPLTDREQAALKALSTLPAVEADFQGRALRQLELWRAESTPSPEGLFLMGELYRRLGKTSEAERSFRASLALKPSPVLLSRIQWGLEHLKAR